MTHWMTHWMTHTGRHTNLLNSLEGLNIWPLTGHAGWT